MEYVNSFNLFGVEAAQIPCIKGSGAPTTATEGAVGCLYMDTDTGDVYKCTTVTDGVYTWTTLGGATNEDLQSIYTGGNMIDKTRLTNGYLDGKGTITSSTSNCVTDYIEIVPGEKYCFDFSLKTYGANNYKNAVAAYDADKAFIGNGYDGSVLWYTEYSEYPITAVGVISCAAPNAKYIRITIHKSVLDTAMMVEGDTYPEEYREYGYTLDNIFRLNDTEKAEVEKMLNGAASPLNGKTAVFDGDSICNGSSAGDGLSGWAGRIGTNNAMTWKNYARGGGTITQIEGHYCIGGNIDTIHSEYPTLDYLIFEGGTNDADLLGEDGLGTFSATDYSGNYNTATFTGAFETLLYKAVTYYPAAKIGYIVAHNMRTTIRRTYFDRAVELCQKWGVPYIDLWYGSHLNRLLPAHYDPSLDSQGNIDAGKLYTDGQHLTPTGYEVITPKIEAWMKNLYTWSNPCNNSNTGDPTQVNDEEIGSAPWSSKNTVDKLCHDINETGSIVICEPVEGYPLEVVASEEATQIVRCGKNLYDVNVYPLTNGRYINKGSGGYTGGAAYAATEDYIPVSHLRGLTINLNHIPGGSNPGMAFYDESHTYISGDKGGEISVPSTASYMRFTVDSSYADGKDVQLEIGDKATAFEPYNGDVFSKGERVPALKGINMLYADSGEITVNGKADPVVVTENLSKVVTGKYELIEDTTLNEDVASFQRNTTPDGVKYNFSAIRIIVETTANTSSANLAHIMYRDNNYYYSFIYVNISGVVTTSAKCSFFKCYNDRGLIDHYYISSTLDGSSTLSRRLSYMCEEWTNVKAIKLTCSANIPAGTRIRIYAIRG